MIEELSLLGMEALDGLGVERPAVDPRHWWQMSSTRIETIAAIGGLLSETVITTVVSLRGSAKRAVKLGVLLVVLAVGGAAVLSLRMWGAVSTAP